MTESELQSRIRLALGRDARHARLFRNNRGLFWAGKVLKRTSDLVVLGHPRQVEAGLVNGASDLIGWTHLIVTSEMVGHPVALFTAAEVKLGGKSVPKHQQRFLDSVTAVGGRAAALRSEDDAQALVRIA